jgi:iron complex transport system substrate-binding protein
MLRWVKPCVPSHPQRIIALDPDRTLDPLVALGINPVGYASYNVQEKEVVFPLSPEDVKDAKNVGNAYQPFNLRLKQF